MTDRSKPRRARSQWDALRVGRAPTPPLGAPEHVDPEVTPPPTELEALEKTTEGFDAMDPTVRAALETLEQNQRELTGAMTRVWDARHLGSTIERLERDVAGFTKDVSASSALLNEFVMPAIKSAMVQLQQLNSFHERHSGRAERLWSEVLPELNGSLTKLCDRLDLIDERITRMESTLERIPQIDLAVRDVNGRVSALERHKADKEAGDKREALVVRRHRGYALALVSVISTAAGIVGGWLGFGHH